VISSGETMEKVRVKPAKLVEKLRENFNRHKEELAKAQSAYRKKAKEVLTARLEKFSTYEKAITRSDLKDTAELPSMYFDLTPPDDHTEDYERAISMLEMCEDETVMVTATQFAAFVQDRWNWKGAFLAKNSSYME
jgi:hypothetical protein